MLRQRCHDDTGADRDDTCPTLAPEKPQTIGLPTVAFMADQLHLSANYFGDLIKKETGKTALEYIQATLLRVAKEKLFQPGKSVNEVGYELGFKYPQHFRRFFKQQIGQSPNEYRRTADADAELRTMSGRNRAAHKLTTFSGVNYQHPE